MRETAEKNCEKRIKEYIKRQNAARTTESLPKGGSSMSCISSMSANQQQTVTVLATGASQTQGRKSGRMLATLKQKIWSSQGNLYKAAKEEEESLPGGSVQSRCLNSNNSAEVGEMHSSGYRSKASKGCLSSSNSFNAGGSRGQDDYSHEVVFFFNFFLFQIAF